MIVTIQMWIAPISYSNPPAAVIAEGIEVDSKPFESILPFKVTVTCACINKLHCIPCLLFVLKIVRVINFRGFHYPRKFFNNKIFPDYGIVLCFIHLHTNMIIQLLSTNCGRIQLSVCCIPWAGRCFVILWLETQNDLVETVFKKVTRYIQHYM